MEDGGTLKATGSLTIADTDTGENQFKTTEDYTGTYGGLTITADGDWEYTLDNTGSKVQGLKQGEVVTDVITVYALDGSATEDVTITITGTNDNPTITSTTPAGKFEGSIVEDTASVTGQLAITDADGGESTFKVQTDDAAPTYGTFSITDAGAWTYKLDNTDTTVQALGAGDTLTDTVSVEAYDGTKQAITVTINGTNDAPEFTSSASEQLGLVTVSYTHLTLPTNREV